MPYKKTSNAATRLAIVLEARAGLAFASDHVAKELHAATSRIAPAVRTYARQTGPEHRAITDMLVDLRHYCDSKGLAFEKLNAEAHAHYQDEKADLF